MMQCIATQCLFNQLDPQPREDDNEWGGCLVLISNQCYEFRVSVVMYCYAMLYEDLDPRLRGDDSVGGGRLVLIRGWVGDAQVEHRWCSGDAWECVGERRQSIGGALVMLGQCVGDAQVELGQSRESESIYCPRVYALLANFSLIKLSISLTPNNLMKLPILGPWLWPSKISYNA